MATNITITTGGSTTVLTVPEKQNIVEVTYGNITNAERAKLAGIEEGATADQVLTSADGNLVLENGPDYEISLSDSIVLNGDITATNSFVDKVLIRDGSTNTLPDNIAAAHFYVDTTGNTHLIAKSGTDLKLKSNQEVNIIHGNTGQTTIGDTQGIEKITLSGTGLTVKASSHQFTFSTSGRLGIGTTDTYYMPVNASGASVGEGLKLGSGGFLEFGSVGADLSTAILDDIGDVTINATIPSLAPGRILTFDPFDNKWKFFNDLGTSLPAPIPGVANVSFASPDTLAAIPGIAFDGANDALSINSTVSYGASGVNLFVDGGARIDGAIEVSSGGTVEYAFPTTDGAADQILITDGAGSLTFDYPQAITESVKNVTTGTLAKGTPVHVTGSTGNTVEVIAADAATNYPAHFILNEDLDAEAEGRGIAIGFINNVDVPDASIYTEGQTVYLGASGGWVTTKPTGTNAIQNLGIIVKVNTSTNKISGVVLGAGRANDVPNLPDGKFFIGSATNTTTSAYTLPTSDGTTGQLLQTDGAGSVSFVDFSGSPWTTSGSDIYYNTGNVGIGTATPAHPLDVNGRVNANNFNGIPVGSLATGNMFVGNSSASGSLYATSIGINAGRQAGGNYGTYLGYYAGNNSNGQGNTAIGQGSGDGWVGATNSKTFNTSIGKNSGYGYGHYNSSLGAYSGSNGGGNVGFEYNSSVGYQSGAMSSGSYNVSVGAHSNNGPGKSYSVSVGSYTNKETSGSNNVAIGHEAAQGVSGSSTFANTVAVGYQALTALTTGTGNTAVGYQASSTLTTASENTALGYSASAIGGQSVAIGADALANNTRSIAIGHEARAYTYDIIAIGDEAGPRNNSGNPSSSVWIGRKSGNANTGNGNGYNVGVGHQAGRMNNSSGNVFIGDTAGYHGGQGANTWVGRGAGSTSGNTSVVYQTVAVGNGARSGNAVGSVSVGYQSGGPTATSDFVAIGYQALSALTTGARNTAVGYQAGKSITTGGANTVIGYGAGDAIIGGTYSVAIGEYALSASTAPAYTVAIGAQALEASTSGDSCVAIGFRAGEGNNGDNNILIGREAGQSGDGSGNIFIGYQAGESETGSNKLYIENSNSATPLIYGEFDNDVVRVNGTLQVNDPSSTGYSFPTATGTTGQVLEVDASGDLVFATPSGGGGGGLGSADQTLTADRTIITTGYDLDIEMTSGDLFTIHDGTHDLFQVDTGTTGTIFSVNDVSGLPKLTVDDSDGVTINKFKEVKYEKPSNTDFSYQGDVVYFGATTGMTQGDLYYYNSSGNWAQADADAASSSGGVLLAIALGTASDTNGMLLKGTFTMAAGAIDGTEATGDELYVSTTAGHITSDVSAYTTGDVVRVVGYCLDGTNGQIWFNPSNDFIELA